MHHLLDPEIWAALLTLTALEIVLGIDNLVFIAITANRLPPERRDSARKFSMPPVSPMAKAARGLMACWRRTTKRLP